MLFFFFFFYQDELLEQYLIWSIDRVVELNVDII